MNEKLLEIFDYLYDNKNYILSFIKKDHYYVIEKSCIINDYLYVLFSEKYKSYKEAKIKYYYMKKIL